MKSDHPLSWSLVVAGEGCPIPYPAPSLVGMKETHSLPWSLVGWKGGGIWGVAFHLPSHSWIGMKEAHSSLRPLVGWGKVGYPPTQPTDGVG